MPNEDTAAAADKSDELLSAILTIVGIAIVAVAIAELAGLWWAVLIVGSWVLLAAFATGQAARKPANAKARR
jgi:hypothetical protein